MKQMEQFIPAEPASDIERRVGVGNVMQLMLAERHGEDIDTFIDQHAADFREVLDIHPEYVEKFEKDPEATLEEIGKSIYH